MSQFGGPMGSKRSLPGKPNIYTVLVLIAFLALGGAIAFVWVKNVQMTKSVQGDGSNPWYVVPKSDDQTSATSTTTP